MQVSVRQVLETAMQFLWDRKSTVPVSAYLPILPMFLVGMVADADGGRAVGASLILMYLGSFIAFFWMRRFLQGPAGVGPNDGMVLGVDGSTIRAGRAVGRLFAFQWRLGLIALIVYVVGGLCEGLLALGIPRAGELPVLYYVGFVILVASPLIVRIWLMVPAAAVGSPYTAIADSWRLTAGLTGPLMRLFAILIGVSLVSMLAVDTLSASLLQLTRGSGALIAGGTYFLLHLVEALYSYILIALWACVGAVVFYLNCPNIGEFAVTRSIGASEPELPVRPAPGH